MRTELTKTLISSVLREERTLANFKEIPCKDMDLDCFALDGTIPFGSYKKCYQYAPELGKCIFYDWEKGASTEDL
jgi:hypothetical protein